MHLSGRFSPRFALAITVFWVAALAISGSTDALLFLAPALLIAIPLCSGRYIGEELIARLASKRRARPARTALREARPLLPLPLVWPARGSRLIAFSLAKRPPPAALPSQS